jgi:hypothetical protein
VLLAVADVTAVGRNGRPHRRGGRACVASVIDTRRHAHDLRAFHDAHSHAVVAQVNHAQVGNSGLALRRVVVGLRALVGLDVFTAPGHQQHHARPSRSHLPKLTQEVALPN